MDDEIEDFLRKHKICYDRFTFDKNFRFLLENDFEHEGAKDVILYNCSLSAFVLQERVHNSYYKKIRADDELSNDLLALKDEVAKDYIKRSIIDILNRK